AYAFIAGEALRSIAVINVDSVVASSCDTLLDVFFDIENRGNNNFRIDSINADGIQIQNIREPIGFPTEMPPGRLLPAHVLFKLPQPGTYTGTLRVYTDANNQALLEIPFRITRDSAQLAFPDIIDFGQIDAAKTSADTTVTITNNGNNDLTINSLSFDDPRFEVIQPAPPLTIPPGGSRTVRVRITPRPGVPERGTLTIIAEPCFTPVDIEVRGFQGAGPLIGIPRSIQFPPFLCDAPEFVDTTIVITAIGDEPLQIDNIQLGGDNPERFSFRRNPAPTTILPQQTDSIVIRYTPSIIGVHRAVVDIRSNARNATDPLQITLTGRKDTAIALPKQRTINFGQLLDCDEPVEMQLTLSNSGTVDATISEIQLDTDAPFSISQSLPFSIPANGTERIITIRFAPQSDGVFTEELRIIGEPCGIDEVITLNGSRQTPSLAADIAMIDFDTVYLCDGATSRTFTLTNDGPVADTIRRFTPAGSDAFSLGGEVYPIILQPGESKNFTLQFDPVIGADVNGSLEFFWGPCDKTTIVNFRGVGADPKVTLSEQSIDFAQVDVVAGLPARRSITIRNEGNAPRVISGINFGGESSLRVVVPTSFPVTIAAGEELVVEIEYLPTQVGLLNATAVVAVEDPCGSSESFGLTGEGTGVKVIEAKLTIRVPQNLSGVVDNLVSIPVEITGGENIAEAGIRELDVKLSWRYTMLLPQSVRTDLPGLSTRILSNEIVGDRRVVELGFFGLDDGSSFPANGTLGTIGALVLLGDRAETDIRVEEIRTVVPANRVMSYQSEDGKFVLLGLCTLDGDRLVSLGGGSLKLSSPRPNPVSGISEFEVETSESGYVEVVLYDAMGTQVKELYAGEVASGVYLLRIDASELSSGLYFCELRRGNAVVRQHVIVTQ
ncbi:MAG: choice-of-anchor D domain-containing protein, partial [Candidatus Kapaibacterium sp.]